LGREGQSGGENPLELHDVSRKKAEQKTRKRRERMEGENWKESRVVWREIGYSRGRKAETSRASRVRKAW